MPYISNFATASFDVGRYLPPEILQEGIEKEWNYDQHCFVYRVTNKEKKSAKKEGLEAVIAHYYKLK